MEAKVTEYRIGRAIVRIHGEPNRENLRAAAEKFAKQVEQIRKKQRLEESTWQEKS